MNKKETLEKIDELIKNGTHQVDFLEAIAIGIRYLVERSGKK